MPVKIRYFSTKQSILLVAAVILLLPALLINLGLVAFYDDEAIRALVALEMQISGNYITPTMFGELYYNKPPLYNWILLFFFELTGRSDEFICRLVTLFFLMLFAGSVFHFYKKEAFFPAKDASTTDLPTFSCINALALITCGRILFWDSMLGLIDVCFSWLMFLIFMLIYQEGERERYGRLFIYTYLLAAAGYMMKGLPSIAFLGIALLTYFIWQKKIKHLFSWGHVLGACLFGLLVGGYYYLYAQENGLEQILHTVFQESAKRTFVEHGMVDTVLHLFSFPFEMWYHFLPWSLLVVGLIRKDVLQILKQHKFMTWNALVLLTAILPYWSSVEVYPRYLFMFVPLFFAVLLYFYVKSKETNGWQAKVVEIVFFVAAVLTALSTVGLFFWGGLPDVPWKHLKLLGLSVFMFSLVWLLWVWKNHRLLIFVLVLLVARIGYNWFVLPSRLPIECSTLVRDSSREAVELANGAPIFIYKYSIGFQPMTGYYFTQATGEILKKQHDKIDEHSFYLVNPGNYDASIFKKLKEVKIKWECSELWFMQWIDREKK